VNERKILGGALKVLLVAALVVVVTEAALWSIPRAWLPDGFELLDRVYTARSGWYQMMMGDDYLGYKLKPDLDILFPSEGRDIPIQTESYGLGEVGFRDVGTKPPFDGVAIGGSFTLCDDVPADRCWVRKLSEETNLSIATLGVNGYSTLASARMLDRYGRQLHPRVVLVDVFLNDFKDNINFERWTQSGSTNFWTWMRRKRGRSEIDRWLSEYSMLYRVYDGSVRARGRRIHPYNEDGLNLVFRLDGWWLQLIDRPQDTRLWGLMQEALLDIKETANEMNAVPVILLFPMKEEVYWDRIRRFAPDLADKDVAHPFNVIRDFCAQQGLLYCDLRAPLQAEAVKGAQVYHRISSHWNDAGNAVAAAAIAECLKDHGLARPPTTH
jgi:hypothetical protein